MIGQGLRLSRRGRTLCSSYFCRCDRIAFLAFSSRSVCRPWLSAEDWGAARGSRFRTSCVGGGCLEVRRPLTTVHERGSRSRRSCCHPASFSSLPPLRSFQSYEYTCRISILAMLLASLFASSRYAAFKNWEPMTQDSMSMSVLVSWLTIPRCYTVIVPCQESSCYVESRNFGNYPLVVTQQAKGGKG